jgi:redox-sensing transcriptional repressor
MTPAGFRSGDNWAGGVVDVSGGGGVSQKLSPGVASRLSAYLRILRQARKQGWDSISSKEISEYSHINPTQVRRDLTAFGRFGKRGVGYNVAFLIVQIEEILRASISHRVVVVGAGNLGRAIVSSSILEEQGFEVVAVFDNDPHKIGTTVHGLVVEPVSGISDFCRREAIEVGVIAVPPEQAQKVADALVEGGVGIIFNYTETLLILPRDIAVNAVTPADQMLCTLYLRGA